MEITKITFDSEMNIKVSMNEVPKINVMPTVPGPKGDIGPQGPIGPKGDKGEDGKTFQVNVVGLLENIVWL